MSLKEKVETLQQAFDGMLGLEPPPGCNTAACTKRRAEAGDRPRSAGAAAALCTEPEGKHYLVDVLCEMGRGMHAWQAMAAVFADPRAVPSEDDWTRALLRGDARDPRLDVWRDPPKSAFEYTLLQSDEDNPLVRPLHSVLSKTHLLLVLTKKRLHSRRWPRGRATRSGRSGRKGGWRSWSTRCPTTSGATRRTTRSSSRSCRPACPPT